MVRAADHAQFRLQSSTNARTEVMRIGILLSEMPRMLHDVVGEILDMVPDLCIVADGVGDGALVERVERERPDVVMLWGETESPPAMCEELLSRFPRLAVVALEDRGRRASIYTMRPMRVRMKSISGSQLVTAIRQAAVRGRRAGAGTLRA
jgi:DNA-binding NarL/FixJ family response regulator